MASVLKDPASVPKDPAPLPALQDSTVALLDKLRQDNHITTIPPMYHTTTDRLV